MVSVMIMRTISNEVLFCGASDNIPLKMIVPITPSIPHAIARVIFVPTNAFFVLPKTNSGKAIANITPVNTKTEGITFNPVFIIMSGQIPQRIPVRTAFQTKLCIASSSSNKLKNAIIMVPII